MKVPVDVIKTAGTKSYNPGPPQQPVGISGSPGEIKATIVVWVVVLRSVGCEPRSTLWWSCHSLQIDDPVPSITTTGLPNMVSDPSYSATSEKSRYAHGSTAQV